MVAKGDYPRMNISITPELRDELEKYRDEINISKVCRSALEQRIESLKRSKGILTENLDETIARLKQEKADYINDFYEMGFKLGYTRASVASFSELMEVVDNIHIDTQLSNEPYCVPNGLPDWVIHEMQVPSGPYINGDFYQKGVLDGVFKFWKDIEDKI